MSIGNLNRKSRAVKGREVVATQVEKMFPLLFVPSDYRKAMSEAAKVMEEAMNAGKGASSTFSAMGDAMRIAGEAATKWLTNPLVDAGVKMVQAAMNAENMGEATGGVGEKLQQANDSINRMYASFGTLLLPVIESGAGVMSQVADSIASMDDDVKGFLLTAGGITAAMGPLSSAMGTVVKLATSPAGIVAALGLVGVAGVKMFQSMEQAALNSRLEERFGSISLSAQEMDAVIEQVLERSRAESLPLTAALDDAQIMDNLEAMMADLDGKSINAVSATMQGVQGEVASTTSAIAQEGNNAAQGYADSLMAGQGIAASAAAALVRAALGSVQTTQASHSPSREFAKLGAYGVQGYAGAIQSGAEEARRSGVLLARAAVEGIAEGQDSHSPSKATAKLGAWSVQGYNNALKQGTQLVRTTSGQLAKESVEAIDEASKKADSSRAARRRARQEAEAAEEARRQATLAGISRTAQATLAADTAAFDKRMGQIARQTQALMDFAGAHAIWYQDSKGDTQVQEVKERYDALIEKEKKRYEAQAAGLTDDEQKKAAKEAYEERTALLKKQRDEETAALKEQYSLQKEMAADWLNSQKSLLQEAMDAKRAAYQEEDYQDELSDLKKRQRQSKSAREKRELQEQIDKMIRDHALEQEEAAMQETLAGYDALIEAVQAGLIGLGDLTGNAAMGDLAFGTAGLTALDNITSAQMEAVLRSLSRDSLAGGTAATVSAAQMAAALSSAGQKSNLPATQTQGGNTYNINLSGAVVRDDSDVTRIVEELERRIRQAER